MRLRYKMQIMTFHDTIPAGNQNCAGLGGVLESSLRKPLILSTTLFSSLLLLLACFEMEIKITGFLLNLSEGRASLSGESIGTKVSGKAWEAEFHCDWTENEFARMAGSASIGRLLGGF